MRKPSRPVSEIDRLIELASAETPHSGLIEGSQPHPPDAPNLSLSLEDKKDPRPSMWRLLLQLRPLLPYLARAVPLLERGLLGTNLTSGVGALGGGAAPAADNGHVERGFASMEGAYRDLSQQMRSQNGEIKYLQEQISWLSKALEAGTTQQEELSSAILSLRKLVQIWAIVATVLLGGLVGLTLFLVFSRPA